MTAFAGWWQEDPVGMVLAFACLAILPMSFIYAVVVQIGLWREARRKP